MKFQIYELLSLALLMFRVITDDPHNTLAMNDLAFVADLFN